MKTLDFFLHPIFNISVCILSMCENCGMLRLGEDWGCGKWTYSMDMILSEWAALALNIKNCRLVKAGTECLLIFNPFYTVFCLARVAGQLLLWGWDLIHCLTRLTSYAKWKEVFAEKHLRITHSKGALGERALAVTMNTNCVKLLAISSILNYNPPFGYMLESRWIAATVQIRWDVASSSGGGGIAPCWRRRPERWIMFTAKSQDAITSGSE